MDEKQKEAVFLPDSLLTGSELEELPLHPDNISYIRHLIDLKSSVDPGRGLCYSIGSAGAPGSHPQAKTLAELVSESKLAVVGTVSAYQHGWNVQIGAPAYLVDVAVTEVLSNQGFWTDVGDTVSYSLKGGSVFFEGTELCLLEEGVEPPPEVGQDVLLLGFPWPEAPPYLAEPIVLPIEGGMVRIKPFSRLIPEADRSLIDVLREARNHHPQDD